MKRRYKFLRRMYKVRRINKELPYGDVSNDRLLENIEDEIKNGRDFIIQF